MKVWDQQLDPSAVSLVVKVAYGPIDVSWQGRTGGTITPQWSKDLGTTWNNFAVGAQSGASGFITQADCNSLWIRLEPDSLTGTIDAWIDGLYVSPVTRP